MVLFIVNFLAFTVVIVPVSFATILLLFVYCMFSSQKGPVKSLLNVLLGSFGCNLIINILNIFSLFSLHWLSRSMDIHFFSNCYSLLFAMRAGFTVFLGLNVDCSCPMSFFCHIRLCVLGIVFQQILLSIWIHYTCDLDIIYKYII